jgi:8-hydroxy-5-deazaflavin:NADPH oxidoreductase
MRRFTRRAVCAAALGAAFLPGAHAADGMRIGIIGAGHVGTTLGRLWAQAGDHVMLSAKDLSDAQAAASSLGPNASAGTTAQAAAFGDVVVLAVPYGAIPSLGPALNPAVAGKTVLDATNPYPFRDGAIAGVAGRDGAGITTQRYFPSAHVVRAFNSIDMSSVEGQAHRAAPLLAVPVAGDDPASVQTVERLVRDAGFEPVRAGGLRDAMQFQPGHIGFELEDDAVSLRRDLHLNP